MTDIRWVKVNTPVVAEAAPLVEALSLFPTLRVVGEPLDRSWVFKDDLLTIRFRYGEGDGGLLGFLHGFCVCIVAAWEKSEEPSVGDVPPFWFGMEYIPKPRPGLRGEEVVGVLICSPSGVESASRAIREVGQVQQELVQPGEEDSESNESKELKPFDEDDVPF